MPVCSFSKICDIYEWIYYEAKGTINSSVSTLKIEVVAGEVRVVA